MKDLPGVSACVKGDDGAVYHAYSCFARGLDPLTPAYSYLDLTPLGRTSQGLDMTIHIAADALTDFCAEVFERVGGKSGEARRVAASLVDANLTGRDSHCVIRMPRYVDWVRSGDIVPNQTIERLVDTPVIAVIDGRFWLWPDGAVEDGLLRRTTEGSPQGGVISPCLSNVFLHYVLDEWFETEVRPRLKGESTLARFADDAIMAFDNIVDAKRSREPLT